MGPKTIAVRPAAGAARAVKSIRAGSGFRMHPGLVERQPGFLGVGEEPGGGGPITIDQNPNRFLDLAGLDPLGIPGWKRLMVG